LGLGESYMDGWWDSDQLDETFSQLLRAQIDQKLQQQLPLITQLLQDRIKHAIANFFNLQTKSRAFIVGEKHYDLGNDFFKHMLDPEMNYTCGYWRNSDNLEDAQIAKLALTCGKLKLRPGMRILDIGCGWGAFAKYAAQHYNATVVGVTVSQEQAAYAQAACRDLPVEIKLQDYRDINGHFDRVVSLGMFEHVGSSNYRTYMQVVHRCLRRGGLFLLHTIGNNYASNLADPWIEKYIFPNGNLPSLSQIGDAISNLFVIEDLHNFGTDYDKTLLAWRANLAAHWPTILQTPGFDERFQRMWHYYLSSCAGGFRARELQLWQIVLSKQGILGGYRSIR